VFVHRVMKNSATTVRTNIRDLLSTEVPATSPPLVASLPCPRNDQRRTAGAEAGTRGLRGWYAIQPPCPTPRILERLSECKSVVESGIITQGLHGHGMRASCPVGTLRNGARPRSWRSRPMPESGTPVEHADFNAKWRCLRPTPASHAGEGRFSLAYPVGHDRACTSSGCRRGMVHSGRGEALTEGQRTRTGRAALRHRSPL